MTFNELIDDQTIAYVPIYSMFDHQTGLIDLECDGNINRWMTNFYKAASKWKDLMVFGPSEDLAKSEENFCQFANKLEENFDNFHYVQSKAFAGGAKKQRSQAFVDELLEQCSGEDLLDRDVVIVESQALFNALYQLKLKTGSYCTLVYWCPVCETNKKTRSFFNKLDKIENESIFKKASYVVVATHEQVEYLRECLVPEENIILVGEFIDRSLPMFASYIRDNDTLSRVESLLSDSCIGVYLPFRLSDEGYRLWDIIDAVYPHLFKHDGSSFAGKAVVLAPNVNGSTVDELVKLCIDHGSKLASCEIRCVLESIVSVPSKRSTFYTLIDCCDKLVVPYFEDYEFVMHAAVDELIRGKTKPRCIVLKTPSALKQYLDDFERISKPSILDSILVKKDHMDAIFKSIVKSSSFKKFFLDCSSSFGSRQDGLPSFIFTGVGKNWYICEKVVKVFISLGIRAQALDCMHALHGDLGMLSAEKSQKVLVYISRSGTTDELVKLAKIIKQFKTARVIENIETVGFFLNREMPNHELFDRMIVPDDLSTLDDIYEFDKRNLVPSLSIDILQLVLDFLGVLLYEGRKDLVDHYVYNHLSGANGKKLGGSSILNNID